MSDKEIRDIKTYHAIKDVVVQPSDKLSDDERRIEQKYLYDIEANLDKYIGLYRARFGKYISADKARLLFPEYVDHPVHYSTAVSAPAFALAENVFNAALNEPVQPDQDIVIILTGGGGSGKTTAAQTRPGTESLLSNSNVIYETLLRTQQRGEKLISSVLSAGKRVGIIYVHRPVEAAAVGALIRAKGNGRIYPISKLASGHYESQNTVLTLYQKYMMHTFVGFLVIDNSGDLGEGRISSINLLEMRGVKYSDVNEIEQRARKAVTDEYIRRRRTDQEIPGDIYIAFTVSTVE